MNKAFKKTVISGLTLAMVLGGSTAAFADGKGRGHDKEDDDNERNYIETRINGNDARNYINTRIKEKAEDINIKAGKVEIKVSFDDLQGGDVEWASRYIASLASKRVFEGYEDGTFQPRKTISRIEAITAAVRLMGLRDQAESATAQQATLNFRDADKLKEKYPWAVGYVSVALQNDLFAETDDVIQPEKAADRLWATTLLVKALKLQDEAKTKMNAKLPFADSEKIPAGSVGYVATAIDHKLINGYEDNTFRPYKPVTRAELAALLDRTGSQLPDHTSIKGTVTAAVYNNLLPITTQNNEALNVELDPNVFVFRNGAKVTPADLQVGDQTLLRTYGGKAIYVEVLNTTTTTTTTPQTTDFTVTGTLNSYTLNTLGKISNISINQNVNGTVSTSVYGVSSTVSISGDVSLLTPGRTVELTGKDLIVNTITIK